MTFTSSFGPGDSRTFSGNARVMDTPPYDGYVNDSFWSGGSSGAYSYHFSVEQYDGMWLNNTNLPSAFPASLWQGPIPGSDEDELEVPYGLLTIEGPRRFGGLNATILSVTPAGAGAVPESATWAMMVVGFGLAGAALRRRKNRIPAALAA